MKSYEDQITKLSNKARELSSKTYENNTIQMDAERFIHSWEDVFFQIGEELQ